MFDNLLNPKGYAKPKLVVRLKTEYYFRGNSLCYSKVLTVLKRKSSSTETLLCNEMGDAWEGERIVNLLEEEDGLYVIERIGEYYDPVYGEYDFDGWKLVTYEED